MASSSLLVGALQTALIPDQSSLPRDPHLVPDFDSKAAPTSPTLYLPPLLSSLPKHISHEHPPNSKFPPLVTETRLPDIDPASLSLHKALHHFRPLTPNYASVPYSEAFNWSELVLPEDEEREWYCVVFRSKKKPDRDDICKLSILPSLLPCQLMLHVLVSSLRC